MDPLFGDLPALTLFLQGDLSFTEIPGPGYKHLSEDPRLGLLMYQGYPLLFQGLKKTKVSKLAEEVIADNHELICISKWKYIWHLKKLLVVD